MLKKFKDTKGFVENVRCSWSTIYFKIGLYKFLKKYQDPKNVSLSSYSFRNNFEWLKQFVKATKNYSHRRRTVQMVLLITIVLIHFPRFVVRLSTRLFLQWDFLFPHETFISGWNFLFFKRLSIFSWDFFFLGKTFSFFGENFSPENYFTQSENFWSISGLMLSAVSKTFLWSRKWKS